MEKRTVSAQNVRMEQFGKNLRLRARQLDLSDAEVARRAGLNERRYGFYVTGEREPDLATLLKIAGVLQSSVDDLLGSTKSSGVSKKAALQAKLVSAAQSLEQANLELLVKTAEAFADHQRSD